MTRLASPVKLIAGILYRNEGFLMEALKALEDRFSPIDYRGDAVPFEATSYYEDEMGSGLVRAICSFRKLIEPTDLVEAKGDARDIEASLSREGRRSVNIDMGYLDLHKVVLASFKERGNKVYLGRGVWADMTLFFRKGGVEALPWSFPDFKAGRYDRDLMEIRMIYRGQLRSLR